MKLLASKNHKQQAKEPFLCRLFHLPFYVFSPFCIFAFLPFLLSSCGGEEGRFLLEGHFQNMNDGELYLYNMENGRKDTIAVRDGQFSHKVDMQDTTTLILLFPNYSELPILARPGSGVEIEGDVSNLKETNVSGNDENEELTAFRMKANEMLPSEVQKAARKFIQEHPSSLVCHYLLRRYFLLVPDADYAEAAKLCKTVIKAQPDNRSVLRLRNQLNGLKNASLTKLPSFSAVSTKGDTIDNSHLKAKVNIIQVWTNWNYDSQSAISLLHRKQREHPDSIAVMTINMDASPEEGRYILERDTIKWPNICDGELWQSPLVSLFGITSIPANIIADKEGNIVGRNLSNAELGSKINDLLH